MALEMGRDLGRGTSSRHINIMILRLAWEILLPVPVGHRVRRGTFDVGADHRCQRATSGPSALFRIHSSTPIV